MFLNLHSIWFYSGCSEDISTFSNLKLTVGKNWFKTLIPNLDFVTTQSSGPKCRMKVNPRQFFRQKRWPSLISHLINKWVSSLLLRRSFSWRLKEEMWPTQEGESKMFWALVRVGNGKLLEWKGWSLTSINCQPPRSYKPKGIPTQ